MSGQPLAAPSGDWETIPAELRERRQWVGWRLRQRSGAPKPTKQPLNPRTGSLGSTTDPATWGTFDEALGCPGANGIGFVFSSGDDYVGVDLDHCRDAASGEVEPWALRIAEQLSSYSEISPSGTGIHVIVSGALPPGRRKLANVEMYSEGRFFTVTGQVLSGAPSSIAARSDELAALHAETFGKQSAPSTAKPTPAALLPDDEVVRRAAEAVNGGKFRALWAGDVSAYASQSEADLALCAILAYWTGGDAAAVDRLFRRSGLFREKWDERHGAQTYGEMTIAKVNQNTTQAATGFSVPTKREGFALTDYGNAERLAARHGHDLRYLTASRQWLHWDGVRWQIDGTGVVMRRAKDTVRSIYSEVAAEEDEQRRRVVAKWATQSESQARLDAMIVLAQSEPAIALLPDELDADPWLLNVQSGTLDLRTGVLGPHRREHLITKLAPVAFDPTARSEIWERFLERVLPEIELREFVQRAVGYSLVGTPVEDVLFFAHGPTRTGKSTFMEALRATLGDYAAVSDFEAFVKRRDAGGPRNDIARLAGARLVVSIEVEDGQQLATSLVKGLTGGDRVTARFLYKEAFEFTPRFTIWIAANHRPRIPDDDSAMWERVREVPFTVTIPPAERDPGVKRTLADPTLSGAAILAWAVRGCLDWQAGGLRAPSAVVDATENYRAEMDPLAPFFTECCVLAPEAWTASVELRAEYERFCRERGEEAISGRAFSGRLPAYGLKASVRGHGNTRGWSGVGLLTGRDEASAASVASAASGTFRNFPSRTGIEPKLPDQPLAAARSARNGPDALTSPTCDDGCGTPVNEPGELCDTCVAAALQGEPQ